MFSNPMEGRQKKIVQLMINLLQSIFKSELFYVLQIREDEILSILFNKNIKNIVRFQISKYEPVVDYFPLVF